jgi:hypothetical protein
VQYVECGACNCFPGSCSRKERDVAAALTQQSVSNALRGEAGYRVIPDGPLVKKAVPLKKNRKQRRFEARIARRGPPAKHRR